MLLHMGLAMIDMRGNLIYAGLFLVMGVVILRLLNRPNGAQGRRRWLAVIAFFCGPACAAMFLVADVLWISPRSYVQDGDFVATLKPLMLIGLFVGGVGGAVFWFSEELSHYVGRIRNSRTASSHERATSPNADQLGDCPSTKD